MTGYWIWINKLELIIILLTLIPFPLISTYDYQLADLILDHSTEVEANDHVMVQLIGLNGINLLRALVQGVRKRGAHPFTQIEDTEVQRELVEQGNENFWKIQG